MVRRRASSGSGVSASALAPRPSYLVSLLFTGLSFSQPGWGQYDDSATCYAPDGTAAASGAYLPCNYGAGVSASMCCASNGDMRSRRDTCTAGGLCLATDGSTQRGYCTDPTWKNPACLSLCVDGNAGGSSSGAAILTTCDGGDTYCCGAGNTTCCGTKYALTLPASATVPASTVVSTAFVTWTPSAAAGDTAANQRSAGALGIADKAGLGAGLGGGALALAALALGLVWRRKRKSAAAAAATAAAGGAGGDQEAAATGRPEPKPQQQHQQQQSELGSHEEQINELSDTGRRAEVAATAVSSGAKREPGAIFELEGDSMPRAKSEPVLATTTTSHNGPRVPVPPTITTTPTSPVTTGDAAAVSPPHDRTRLSPPAPPPPAPGRHRRRHHHHHHPDDLDEICQVEGGDEACPPYEDGVGRDTKG